MAVVSPCGVERIVDLSPSILPFAARGLTGICIHDNRIVLAVQSSVLSILLVLDRDYEVQGEIRLPNAADLHGVIARGTELVVVSTGTNKVIAVDWPAGGQGRVIWEEVGVETDRDHLNDLTVTENGTLLVSRFGPRRSDHMRSGAVFEPDTGRVLLGGLREPHSVCCWHSVVHVLESVAGDLIRAPGDTVPQRVMGIIGYARGLSLDDEYIVIARSGYRESSRGTLGGRRSAPFLAPPAGDEFLRYSGLCFIAQDAGTTRWVDTTICGPEIYQVVPLSD